MSEEVFLFPFKCQVGVRFAEMRHFTGWEILCHRLPKLVKLTLVFIGDECPTGEFPKDFTYKVINIADVTSSSLIRHLPGAIQFIKDGIQKGGVLVHCHAGVSRSSSCVIAFLMQDRGITFQQAFLLAS